MHGQVTLSNVQRGPAQSASLGYWLSKASTGQGLMTEAVTAICHWAFLTLNLQRIEAGTLEDNQRSQGVLIRSGFEREGLAKRYLEIAGKRRDHVLYALVRDSD